MKYTPAVFAVHDTYHIMVPVIEESLMWVRVGSKIYYDEINGVMRSLSGVHRMVVPMDELDTACHYTLCERKILERKAYFTETEEIEEHDFSFRPVRAECPCCYHISDAHNMETEPIAAAHTYGQIDFLIMNGDIPDCSDRLEYFDSIYRIAYAVTKGEIPIVFARGNHDMRGRYAEKIADYTPNENGNTYFTFRLGSIWGLILDCGEDKDESMPNYGHTVCCHVFRERQTEFIKEVIRGKEYEDPGIRWRVIVSHNPFSVRKESVFEIERDLYTEWSELIKENIRPDVMICGHEHRLRVLSQRELNGTEHPCSIIVGAKIIKKERYFAGTGIAFEKEVISVLFTDNRGNLLDRHWIKKNDQ